MPSSKTVIFRDINTHAPFEAFVTSYTEPEPSWMQWIEGLPEGLQKPGAEFYVVNSAGLIVVTVSENTRTNSIIRNQVGAVLCEITGVMSRKSYSDVVEASEERCGRPGCGHLKTQHLPECSQRGPCRDPKCGCGKDDKACNCTAFIAVGSCRECGRNDVHGPWCPLGVARDEGGSNVVQPHERAEDP